MSLIFCQLDFKPNEDIFLNLQATISKINENKDRTEKNNI